MPRHTRTARGQIFGLGKKGKKGKVRKSKRKRKRKRNRRIEGRDGDLPQKKEKEIIWKIIEKYPSFVLLSFPTPFVVVRVVFCPLLPLPLPRPFPSISRLYCLQRLFT